ncbi:four helix bundle protein [Pricia sp. S334]|uniref:Four helix bundle protein n=1 Tax=Pricia mediterranea TaxID=3076079 RepID=A0ABU3L922_9FLAO|nr:four helix bundle protein [Pricia sp. S334]MDT7830246.1 four helix bundle protein [Pricia sp. S334]
MTHNFRKLKIWSEGISLVRDSYKMTRTFPEYEKYGLANQMNRCAVSIPSNIAEGSSKGTDRHFGKFLETSLGSAFEWETQLVVAFNEGYIKEEKFKNLKDRIQQLQKMISRFRGGLGH